MRLLLVASILAVTTATASTRSDLDSTLAAFTGLGAVRARVELDLVRSRGDSKHPDSQKDSAHATVDRRDGALMISWGLDQLQPPAKADEGNATAAIEQLSATRICHYLNAAPQLIDALRDAEITAEIPGDWNGVPARVLSFRLKPKLSDHDRKYIKHLDATATVWLAADGTPLAAKRQVQVKGRAMIVISFESSETEQYEFARVGDCLVVTRHEHEAQGSGGGESNQQRTTARLTLEPVEA